MSGLRYTLAGVMAAVRNTLSQVMLVMSKTTLEVAADRVLGEDSGGDTDSSEEEEKPRGRQAKGSKGKGSYQGGEMSEVLHSLKTMLVASVPVPRAVEGARGA